MPEAIRPVTTTVTVHGLRELERRLKALPPRLSGKNGGPLRAALFQAAKIIREAVKQLAPQGVDTPVPGRIKANVIAVRERNPRQHGASEMYHVVIRGSAQNYRAWDEQADDPRNAYYWKFKEFGTVKMAAEPFMRPGFDASVDAALGKFVEKLSRDLDRIERTLGIRVRP